MSELSLHIAEAIWSGAGARVRATTDLSVDKIDQAVKAGLIAFEHAYQQGQRRALEHAEVEFPTASLTRYLDCKDVLREFSMTLRASRLNVEELLYIAQTEGGGYSLKASYLKPALLAFEVVVRVGLAKYSGLPDHTSPKNLLDAGEIQLTQLESAQSLTAQVELKGAVGSLIADKVAGHNVVVGTQFTFNWASDVSTDSFDALRQAYLATLLNQCRFLSLTGIDPKAVESSSPQLELDALFVALHTKEAAPDLRTSTRPRDDREASREISPSRYTCLAHLNSHSRLVLLGDPGSGKSAIVNFLSSCIAGAYLGFADANIERLNSAYNRVLFAHREAIKWEHGLLLPVRVVLRDFVARKLQNSQSRSGLKEFWEYISDQLEAAGIGEFFTALRTELATAGGILLFDGLDEVPDANRQRVQIKQIIEQLSALLPKVRIVVTGRTYAYQQQDWKLQGFESATISDLGSSQVQEFVDRWYEHLGHLRKLDSGNAHGRAAILKEAISRSKSLADLARRPLLLTLMASLHAWRGGSLPERREELYADAVTLLLDSWENQRVVYNADGSVAMIQPSLAEWLQVDRQRVRLMLERLAFEAHDEQGLESGTADVLEDRLISELTRLSSNPDVRPARLVEYLSHRAGLLVPQGVGVYTFPHRTFQEYLAACHLTGENYPDELARLLAAEPLKWREVTLLAAAKAARGAGSTIWSLVDALCYKDPDACSSANERLSATTAGQAVTESGVFQGSVPDQHAAKLKRVVNWQLSNISCGALTAFERALSGDVLGKIGDPREEILDVDRMSFCWVPSSSFFMGHEDEVVVYGDRSPSAGGSDVTLHQMEPLDGFWASKHLVSIAQYMTAVDDGLYEDSALWVEAEQHGLWQPGKVRNTRDGLFANHDRRESQEPFEVDMDKFDWTSPMPKEGDSGHPQNYPISGLSWYECLAFARWVNKRSSSYPVMRKFEVCLPSEAEWELAGRGGLKVPVEPHIRVIGECESEPEVAQESNEFPRRVYPWGEHYDECRMNCAEGTIPEFAYPLGIYPAGASPYGLEDMIGNIWQWTRSAYGYAKRVPLYRYPYADATEREKLDMPSGVLRVLRGGHGGLSHASVKLPWRFGLPGIAAGGAIGIRLALVPK